jgi:hypothetical protein
LLLILMIWWWWIVVSLLRLQQWSWLKMCSSGGDGFLLCHVIVATLIPSTGTFHVPLNS